MAMEEVRGTGETRAASTSAEVSTASQRALAGRSVATFKIIKDGSGNTTRYAEVDGNVVANEIREAPRPPIASVSDPVPAPEELSETPVVTPPTSEAAQPSVVQNEEPGFFARTYKAAADSLSSLFSDISGWAGNSTVASDVKGRKSDIEHMQ